MKRVYYYCSLAQREKKGLFFVVGWDGGEEAANQGQTIFRYFAGRHPPPTPRVHNIINHHQSSQQGILSLLPRGVGTPTHGERERERERKGRKT
jgi:hypothetical protein